MSKATSQSNSTSDRATDKAAAHIAKELFEKAFEGRSGHGGARATERHWKRGQLETWLVAAFKLGAEWERERVTVALRQIRALTDRPSSCADAIDSIRQIVVKVLGLPPEEGRW